MRIVVALARVLAVAAVIAAAVTATALGRRNVHATDATTTLHVPLAPDPKLDGELVEDAWHATPVVHLKKRDGSEGRPYSDVRFLRSAKFLYVGLYASDHDIVSAGVAHDGPVWLGDSFHVVFRDDAGEERAIDVGIASGGGGVVTDGARRAGGAWDYAWESGAEIATDTDGTVDHPGDNDEEWVVEMRVPLASLHLADGAHVFVRVRRCDVAARGAIASAPCSETDPIELVLGK